MALLLIELPIQYGSANHVQTFNINCITRIYRNQANAEYTTIEFTSGNPVMVPLSYDEVISRIRALNPSNP
jgi:uncharacterized protein YlzI (FlbEa/FlbD family)